MIYRISLGAYVRHYIVDLSGAPAVAHTFALQTVARRRP